MRGWIEVAWFVVQALEVAVALIASLLGVKFDREPV